MDQTEAKVGTTVLFTMILLGVSGLAAVVGYAVGYDRGYTRGVADTREDIPKPSIPPGLPNVERVDEIRR